METSTNPKPLKSIWVTYVIYFSAIAMFAVIMLAILRMTGNVQDVDEQRAKERADILKQIRATAQEELTQPAWIDKEKGIVRLPIDVAMELTVKELKEKKVEKAGLAQPQPSNIKPPVPPS
jgi:hypothetical protein